MFILLMHSFIFWIGTSFCIAMDTKSHFQKNKLSPHNENLKKFLAFDPLKKTLKIEEEKISTEKQIWLETTSIKTEDGKHYRFYIPDEVRIEALKNPQIYKKIETAAQDIEKMEGISPDVAGFSLILFEENIYIRRFLKKKNAR